MSKNNGLRKIRRFEFRKKKAVAEVTNMFLKMQCRPLRERLKLALCLVFRSDVVFFARKQGKSVDEMVKSIMGIF